MDNSYEPWYMQAAKINNTRDREEFIKGVFGFPAKETPSNNGITSFLTGTSILYGLGAMFYGLRAKKKQEEENFQASNNLLGDGFNDLIDDFKSLDFTEEIHEIIRPVEDSLESARRTIISLEEKMGTPEFAEIIDIVPRKYKIALKEQVNIYSNYIFDVELLINQIRSNKWRTEDIESLISDISACGKKFEEVCRIERETEQIISSWLDKNENNQDGKNVKTLLNKIDL